MPTIPFLCLPKKTIYYGATDITHRGKTRFDIKTAMYHPEEKRFFHSKRPIESILLYHYATPLSSVDPVSLDHRTLTVIDLGILNDTNTENPALKALHTYRNRPCFSFLYSDGNQFNDDWFIQLPKLVLARHCCPIVCFK
jgi:hypothetical protein